MKIEIATQDILPLRRMVAEQHNRIAQYPVVLSETPGFEATRKNCIADMDRLRKLHRRLTLAAREVHGHDCNPEELY